MFSLQTLRSPLQRFFSDLKLKAKTLRHGKLAHKLTILIQIKKTENKKLFLLGKALLQDDSLLYYLK